MDTIIHSCYFELPESLSLEDVLSGKIDIFKKVNFDSSFDVRPIAESMFIDDAILEILSDDLLREIAKQFKEDSDLIDRLDNYLYPIGEFARSRYLPFSHDKTYKSFYSELVRARN